MAYDPWNPPTMIDRWIADAARALPEAQIERNDGDGFTKIAAFWDWAARPETTAARAATTIASRRSLDLLGYRCDLFLVADDPSRVGALRHTYPGALTGSDRQARGWTREDISAALSRAADREALAYASYLDRLARAADPEGVARRPAPGAKLARIEAMAADAFRRRSRAHCRRPARRARRGPGAPARGPVQKDSRLGETGRALV